MKPSDELLKALAVTAELTGTELSEPAARVMAQDLTAYPFLSVIAALKLCRRELTGKLTLAAIIQRIDDGRPGPEEAWAMIPMDEGSSVVWTEEMAQAFGVSGALIQAGDKIAARMAFLEHYRKAVRESRDAAKPVRWSASLGHDVGGRECVLIEAMNRGRIGRDYVSGLLPHRVEPAESVLALIPDMSAKRSLMAALAEARAKSA